MENLRQPILLQGRKPGTPSSVSSEDALSIPVPELVFIPPGTFWMGSSDSDYAASEDEKPRHRVFLDGYWIGRYPVTAREYAAFMRDPSCHDNFHENNIHPLSLPDVFQIHIHQTVRGHYPVTDVSWADATAYCRWLSRVTRRHFYLPSEAQWEKAARGSEVDGEEERIYPWGNAPPDYNHCNLENWFADTTPVGLFSPQGDSPYGCADMAGNVLEWCANWYRADDYAHSAYRNPAGPFHGTERVLRGGCWFYPPVFARSASRLWLNPQCRYDLIGFRVVMRSSTV